MLDSVFSAVPRGPQHVPRFVARWDMRSRGEETIAALTRELDRTYRTVAASLPSNPGARVEQVDGKDDLTVTPLEKLDDRTA